MINIYAVNYTDENQVFHDTWTLIQSIPAEATADIALINPSIDLKIDSAETMNFTVQANTKFYNAFHQMKSYIRVDYDDITVFYGRVLTIDTGYFGDRKVQCEGPIAFLNDTYQEGKKESDRNKVSVYEYLSEIVSAHNANTVEDFKKIYLGEVPGNYSNDISAEQKVTVEDRKFGETSWVTTKSALENLKSHHGGFMMIRYADGQLYLDWLQHYTNRTTINQTVAIGKNVIDLNYITEVNNLFTAIIPFGRSGNNNLTIKGYREDIHGVNNYLRVDAITQIYTDEQLNSGYHTADDYRNSYNKYGLIFKTVDLSEETTKESLFNKAAEWIKDNYFGGIDSFTVSAIDMHLIGENEAPIMLGNRVNIQYVDDVSVSRVLTCTSIKLDLYNPEKNQYSFGIPSTSLNRSYSVTSKKSASSTPVPSSYNPPPDELDEQAMWEQEVFGWLRMHQVWKKSNGNVEGGPNSSRYMNTFLRPAPDVDEEGESKQYLWRPQIASVTGGIVNFAKDENGHPLGTWVKIKKSELTASRILSTALVQYIKMEYGFDIRDGTASGFGVSMPSIITDDDGGTSIFGPILEDGDGNSLVQKLLDLGKEGKIMDIFEKDGTTLSAWIDDLGDYHYFEKNPDGSIKVDDQGNPVELSVHQINEDVVEVRSKIFTVESDYIQFKSETESSIAAIEITAEEIRSEVASADSSLYSAIEQTASAIRSSVSDTEQNLYNYINQTASGTWQRIINYTNRTWIQDNDPTVGPEPEDAKEGDIWVESTLQGTWEGAEGFDWEHDQDYDWSKVQGAKIWVRKNNKWELASDQQQVVTYSDVVNTAEHYVNLKIAGIVNDEGLLDIYMAKIEQTATAIRLEVNAADSVLYSFINQTASNIRSEVGNQIDGVTSSIEQTAANIRAEVNASNSEVYSFVEQTSSYIRSEVGDAVSDVFSAIVQTASSIRAEVSASNSEVYSFVEQTASYIRSEVGDTVSDVYSAIEQTASSIRAEVTASNSEVYSYVEQTASYIRSEVGNSLSDVQSSIAQTAESIRSEVNASNSDIYSAIEQTASSIKSEVGNSLSDVYSSITQTADSIRSDISASDSEVYSAIEQTANSIKSEVGNSLSGVYSSIAQTAESIRSDISASDSEVYSAIEQTASSIKSEVGNSLSGVYSSIAQTANTIRSEVNAADSDIYSAIEQSASQIRTEIVNTESGLYNYVLQTASGTRQYVLSTTNRTWVQDTDPTTPEGGNNVTKEGDIWIESTSQGTWEGAEGFNWEHDGQYDWTQIQGAKVWAWKNNKWELAADQQQLVTYTDVVDTAEHYSRMMFEEFVNDGIVDELGSRIDQTARAILLEVFTSDSEIYSAIDQTASYIRAEVANELEDVGSTIEQTATQIRAEVHASSSEVYSFVEQTASSIKSEVGDSLSGVYSSIAQTANSIRSEVHAADSQLYSAIEQSASGISLQVANKPSVARSKTAPTSIDGRGLKENDLWIESENQDSWDAIYDANISWNDESQIEWNKLRSDSIWVYRNGQWVQVLDGVNLVNDADIQLTENSIRMFARKLEQVNGEKEAHYAELKIDADRIRSEVSAKYSGLSSSITQTAAQIRSEVNNSISGLSSSITQTAEQIRSEVNAANSQIYSSITQTASQIKSEVGNDISGLRSSITQQANKIALVVDSDNHIKPAEIVAAINAQTGASTVRLSANMVYISGTTKINDIFGVNSSGFLTVNGDIYQNGTIHPTGISLAEGGSVGFTVGTSPPVSVSLTGSHVQNMIVKAEVSGNTLKLWKRGDAADSPSINFSKPSTTPTISNSSSDIYTSSSWPSGATDLSRIVSQFNKAKADGDNLIIRVHVGSTIRTFACTP